MDIDLEKVRRALQEAPTAYSGRHFSVRRLSGTTKAGKHFTYDAVDHPGAVAILPVFENGDLLLIRNRRPIVGEILWEVPAGLLEKDEKLLAAAHRELLEETGYTAHSMEPLTAFYSSPGFSNEVLFSFLAQDLSFQGQQLEDDEDIEPKKVPLEQALQMIINGLVHDGKSVTTILYYALALQRNKHNV